MSVCSCLHPFPSLVRPYVQIIRCVCHRQHRRSFKECYATSLRSFGLPFGTSDRPQPPLHWAASVAALYRDFNPRSHFSRPQSFENRMWLPRALSCPATPARSAFSQIRTQVPSRPVGPSLHPTLSLSCQQALCHSLLLSYSYLLDVDVITYITVKHSVFHHLCNSSIYGISLWRRTGTDFGYECTSGTCANACVLDLSRDSTTCTTATSS